MKLVHTNDTRREPPEQLRQVGELLREIFSDIAAMENPFDHLLPPDRPPPASPLGSRPPPVYDELPEEVEAAERAVSR